MEARLVDKMDVLARFVKTQSLPEEYINIALEWFTPLAEQLSLHHQKAGRTIFIGINGCQGSGKSTLTALLCDLLTHVYKKPCIGISIDDFYLSKSERNALSKSVHPLLQTRGVPGTHNVPLMNESISALLSQRTCTLPVFSKAQDDVAQHHDWRKIEHAYDIVILEGWCVGVTAQQQSQLADPVNELEEIHDNLCIWRKYVNDALSTHYAHVFAQIDHLVMLQAPSFECVYRWRCEQEHKLISKLKSQNKALDQAMSDQQIYNFIQFYQRLTDHALSTLPGQSDYLFQLDNNRGIQSCQTR